MGNHLMKQIILGALAFSVVCGSADAKAKHSYWQGVCDGLRGSEKYPVTTKLAAVAVRKGRTSEYFACNPLVQGSGIADVTVFIHEDETSANYYSDY